MQPKVFKVLIISSIVFVEYTESHCLDVGKITHNEPFLFHTYYVWKQYGKTVCKVIHLSPLHAFFLLHVFCVHLIPSSFHQVQCCFLRFFQYVGLHCAHKKYVAGIFSPYWKILIRNFCSCRYGRSYTFSVISCCFSSTG